VDAAARPGAVAVIRPREIGFVSYPYEWCFGALKAAALLTLELQERALAAGMRLRDASAFNIQFEGTRPILIDSLSFEVGDPTQPWVGYRQFCEHFLAPLSLIAYRDARSGLLLREFLDGVPLDLATRLLPIRTRLSLGLGPHLHLHARAQRRAGRPMGSEPRTHRPPERRMSETGQRALLDSLRRTVEGLHWDGRDSHWTEYGPTTSYTHAAAASKRAIVSRFLADAGGSTAWDLGANVGDFSRLAADGGRRVVAFDNDAASVEQHWRRLRADAAGEILPLVMDMANPSPRLGWALEERRSIVDRGPADVGLALALVHHLAIGRNVPLPMLAAFLARLARLLIIEFVPKDDPMTRRLLAARRDVFPDYTLDAFRAAFAERFQVRAEASIEESLRTLFLLERRSE
jgi:hypothetical protein